NCTLGLRLASPGRNQEAARYLKAATALKPSNPAAGQNVHFNTWLVLAKVEESNSPKEALAAYKHAAELAPKDFDVHYSQARLLERQNDFEAAAQQYKEALQIDPRSSDAAAGLANAYMGLKRLPEAEEALRNYLKLSPKESNAHLQLGRVLAGSGKYDQDLAEYQA